MLLGRKPKRQIKTTDTTNSVPGMTGTPGPTIRRELTNYLATSRPARPRAQPTLLSSTPRSHPKEALRDGEPGQDQQPRPAHPGAEDGGPAAVLEVPAVPQAGGQSGAPQGVPFPRMPHLLESDYIPASACLTRPGEGGGMTGFFT